jgi:hypothetical protein
MGGALADNFSNMYMLYYVNHGAMT